MSTPDGPDLEALRQAILSGDPSRAMPALAGLREVPDGQAIPLLLLGLRQSTFMIRSLACAGLGIKRSEEGWGELQRLLQQDEDPNVRAEAANALASYGVERAWPLLRDSFAADHHWLVRCSILSALAEQPEMGPDWLLELADLALTDGDGTVRAGGAEILGRLVRDAGAGDPEGGSAGGSGEAQARLQAVRERLLGLQSDPDHRVVAVALNGLQA